MFDVWTHQGRAVPVRSMTDHHLLSSIENVRKERFLIVPPGEDLDEFDSEATARRTIEARHKYREQWLTVLEAEAIRRGLNPAEPLATNVGLIDWLFEEMDRRGYRGTCFHPDTFRCHVAPILADVGIEQPRIDVNEIDGRPVSRRRQAGETPLPGR